MLNQLKWKLIRFMTDRYGVDELYKASGLLFIVLQLLQVFVQNPFLRITSSLLLGGMLYRSLSKDISARQKENHKFMKFVSTVKSQWNLFPRRIKDRGSHRYRQCTECATILRLPRKKGVHKARCPKCGHLFDVKIWM